MVIAFRGRPYLARLENCLRSLVEQTELPTEIIVSEQDGAGLASQVCEEVGATHIITAARDMFNKSACLNVGIKHTTTNHVYLLDADVILAPTALATIKRRVKPNSFLMLDAYRATVVGNSSWGEAIGGAWEVPWSTRCTGMMNATTRKNWFDIRGYDERFVGWGAEDDFVVWKAEFKKIETDWLQHVGIHQEHKRDKTYMSRRNVNRGLKDKLRTSRWPTVWGEDRPVSVVRRLPVVTRRVPEASNEDSPVLILGFTHRCGSTLVQRLVSSDPRTHIWGEPNHLGKVLAGLSPFLAHTPDEGMLRSAAAHPESLEHGSPRGTVGQEGWVALLQPPKEYARMAAAAMLEAFFGKPALDIFKKPRWGFKFVWGANEWAEAFLEVFPQAKVLFLVRDPVTAWPSSMSLMNGPKPPEFEKMWLRSYALYNRMKVLDAVKLVVYEDLVSRPGALAEIEKFAGVSIDRSVMTRKVGGHRHHGRPDPVPFPTLEARYHALCK